MPTTIIRDFEKGVITDGDSPDMPLNSAVVLNNMDIDKTTQRLITRLPFYEYRDLGTIPNVSGYTIWNVVQYTVGVVEPQFNTMFLLRTWEPTGTNPTSWDWKIYDNGPTGGDGNDFVLIADEVQATHCEPSAVLGRVRLALGNARHYRIYGEHRNTDYYPTSDPALAGYGSTVTNLESYLQGQVGAFFKTGVGNNTHNYMYEDGRLYLDNTGAVDLQVGASSVLGIALNKGTYEFILSPVFDAFPEQYGAPISKGSMYVADDPVRIPASNVLSIIHGASYEVKPVEPYSWVGYTATYSYSTGASTVPVAIAWLDAQGLLGVSGYRDWNDPAHPGYQEAIVYCPENGTIKDISGDFAVSKGDAYMYRQNPPAPLTKYTKLSSTEVEYWRRDNSAFVIGPRDTQISAIPSNITSAVYTYYVKIPCYNFEKLGKPAHFEVEYPAASGHVISPGSIFEVPEDVNAPTDFDVYLVDIHGGRTKLNSTPITAPIPYVVLNQPITNPDTRALFSGEFAGKLRGITTEPVVHVGRLEQWEFYYVDKAPLVVAAEIYSGVKIDLTVKSPLTGFNPRLLDYALFVRYTAVGIPASSDFTLWSRIKVRSDSQSQGSWTISNLGYALNSQSFNNSNKDTNLGTWIANYEIDGTGMFRPYDHTVEDITRKMNQMTAMRDRLHAIGIDGDEGQELVGRTPVTGGMSQHDVWFRPLIAHAGKGFAINHALEFQDRLIWFQNTNLIYGSFGDSRNPGDYEFINTGTGIGTHITRTISSSNDYAYFANYDGIWKFDGSKATDLTIQRINTYWRYQVTKAQKDASIGRYNPKTNEYWLYIPNDPKYYKNPTITPPNADVVKIPDSFPVESAIGSALDGVIWVWDDNITKEGWRTYTLDKTVVNNQLTTYVPLIFFSDYYNNFVFVGYGEKAYFWPGENFQDSDPHYPITFEMQTQDMGQREYDMIPDKLRIICEDNRVNYTLTARVYRDKSTTQYQELLMPALNRRVRRLDRKRSMTARIGLSGVYDPTTQQRMLPTMTGTSLIDLKTEHILYRPEIREIHLEVIPSEKRT